MSPAQRIEVRSPTEQPNWTDFHDYSTPAPKPPPEDIFELAERLPHWIAPLFLGCIFGFLFCAIVAAPHWSQRPSYTFEPYYSEFELDGEQAVEPPSFQTSRFSPRGSSAQSNYRVRVRG